MRLFVHGVRSQSRVEEVTAFGSPLGDPLPFSDQYEVIALPESASSVLHRLISLIEPDSTLLRSWPLTGGISAQVTAVEVLLADGCTRKMVIRQHGLNDLRRNPNVAVDEFKLLQTLCSAGLPVPQPYFVDRSGQFVPTPCVVLDYIEGAADLSPRDPMAFATQVATQLARIHHVDTSSLTFLPREEVRVEQWIANDPPELDQMLSEGRIRTALQAAWPLPHPNRPALLHGDYWPGNILWKDGHVTGIIDWEDAALGDPLSDVASSRLEILWTCGWDAMERFTDHYRSLNCIDLLGLPYWDIYTACRSVATIAGWGLDQEVEQRMREHYQSFISLAFARLRENSEPAL